MLPANNTFFKDQLACVHCFKQARLVELIVAHRGEINSFIGGQSVSNNGRIDETDGFKRVRWNEENARLDSPHAGESRQGNADILNTIS